MGTVCVDVKWMVGCSCSKDSSSTCLCVSVFICSRVEKCGMFMYVSMQ